MLFPVLCATLLLTNAVDVMSAQTSFRQTVPFVLEGTVACVVEPARLGFVLTDGSGSTVLVDDRAAQRRDFYCRPGDVVRVSGHVTVHKGNLSAPCREFVLLGHRSPPPPHNVTIRDAKSGRYDGCFIRIGGFVRESFRDEIDPNFTHLVLNDSTGSIYTFAHVRPDEPDRLGKLTGAEITVQGICRPYISGARRQLGRTVAISDANAIAVLRPARKAPSDIPAVSGRTRLNPDQILAMGQCRIAGRVIAVRQNRRAILRDDDGEVHNIAFVEGELPPFGAYGEATGFATTDLYHIHLTGALWRRLEPPERTPPDEPPLDVTAADLLCDDDGNERLLARMHGTLVRLRGTVLEIPAEENRHGRMLLKSGGHTVPVDVSACRQALDGIVVGCEVEITGCCVADTENWHAYTAFPHATGMGIVLRTPGDLVLLAMPPWWTPRRLLIVIGGLIVFLAALAAWSISLWAMAIRRGRQLFKEQVGRISSELRVEERTRLSVELHDSISQTLTGISLEVDTANKVADESPSSLHEHLATASRALQSCRDELRHCLWDLRSRALEESTMDAAIRQTLAPHLADTALDVRFDVPRARISDSTAHTILRIIRELALNGIRHGAATKIVVTGELTGRQMVFGVRDNGCGFDPETAPGFEQGHYGLLGIRERIEELEGEFTLASEPGKGTTATIAIAMPQEAERKNNAR